MKTPFKLMAFAAILAVIVLSSCNKGKTTTTSAVNKMLLEFRTQPQTHTITAGSYQTIIGNQGTRLTFMPNSLLRPNGQPATGTVTITLNEIYKASDMILNNATTTSNGKFLISGGEVFIEARANGEKLRINKAEPVWLTYANNGAFDADMELFRGEMASAPDLAQDSILNWEPAGQDAAQDTFNGYGFVLDSFGWSNCDRFMNNSPGTGTAVLIQSQEGFDNNNTAVYMIFNAEKTAAPSDEYDENTGKFGFHSDGNTPIGMNVTIVAIAEIDEKSYISIVPAVTTANIVIPLDMKQHTKAEIKSMIADL